MRHLRIIGLVVLGGLLSACQSQQQPPREGAYVDLVTEMMVAAAKLSEGPEDAAPAVRAVDAWRGPGEDEGAE